MVIMVYLAITAVLPPTRVVDYGCWQCRRSPTLAPTKMLTGVP